MMVKLTPVFDNLIVALDAQEEVTKSGIYLPPSDEKMKHRTGLVVSVGPGRILENGTVLPMPCKVGQKVLFSSYSELEFKLGNMEVAVLYSGDVLAIVED